MDFQLGRRWTLRPDDGPVPWWIFDAARRVPGTYVRDYLVLLDPDEAPSGTPYRRDRSP